MERYISYKKLSKKKKREHAQKHHGTWGEISPVMRTTPNAKAYNRKTSRLWKDNNLNGGALFIALFLDVF